VFRLADPDRQPEAPILIAGCGDQAGIDALARSRSEHWQRPAIAVLPEGAAVPARYAVEASRLVRELLPLLNRVVELEGLGTTASRVSHAGPEAPPGQVVPQAADAVTAVPSASCDVPGDLPEGDTRPCVLVIEDSLTVRTQLTGAFERMGLAVDTATCAREALSRLQSRRVDLAMLDLGLPDLDGLQLARLIRDEPRWRTLPIVALSSRTSPLDIVRGAAAGCDAYLGKPVGYGDLQRTVVGQLRRAMGTDALPPGLRALTA
jgi:CheY-like chemotaxis protein